MWLATQRHWEHSKQLLQAALFGCHEDIFHNPRFQLAILGFILSNRILHLLDPPLASGNAVYIEHIVRNALGSAPPALPQESSACMTPTNLARRLLHEVAQDMCEARIQFGRQPSEPTPQNLTWQHSQQRVAVYRMLTAAALSSVWRPAHAVEYDRIVADSAACWNDQNQGKPPSEQFPAFPTRRCGGVSAICQVKVDTLCLSCQIMLCQNCTITCRVCKYGFCGSCHDHLLHAMRVQPHLQFPDTFPAPRGAAPDPAQVLQTSGPDQVRTSGRGFGTSDPGSVASYGFSPGCPGIIFLNANFACR